MAFNYFGKNIRPFTAVCDCDFGRKIIKTNKSKINASNIVEELNKALAIHNQKKCNIHYAKGYAATS